jgi:hypothetical protein
MDDLVEKLMNIKLNEEAEEAFYKIAIPLNFNITDLPVDHEVSSIKANVSFEIEMEYRSWGIKDISIVPRGVVNFEIEITDTDDKVVNTISGKIDWLEVSYEFNWINGNAYTIEDLEVDMDMRGLVSKVTINAIYSKPN